MIRTLLELSLLDPWPAYWGNEWYDNDDVYVDYVDNGYYLFNRGYPGIGISVSVSMQLFGSANSKRPALHCGQLRPDGR